MNVGKFPKVRRWARAEISPKNWLRCERQTSAGKKPKAAMKLQSKMLAKRSCSRNEKIIFPPALIDTQKREKRKFIFITLDRHARPSDNFVPQQQNGNSNNQHIVRKIYFRV